MASLYRHAGVALLRTAARPIDDTPGIWPKLEDPADCRTWLRRTWARPGLADAVAQASSSLASRVDGIVSGRHATDRQLRRATVSVVRYLLRATGRPTPFGLFAGVTPVTFGSTARTRRTDRSRPVAKVNSAWLADVVSSLEACPELLNRLQVVFSDLAVQRGGRVELPRGASRVTMRCTGAVRVVRDAATVPVCLADLAGKLAETFPDVTAEVRGRLITRLVRHGFLVTSLRAPLTTVDPLTHLIRGLHEAGADELTATEPVLDELEAVRADLDRHNRVIGADDERRRIRAALTHRMRSLSTAGRPGPAVDLLLDHDVQLPDNVTEEMERAADALLRLSRRPAGLREWRDYHAAFRDRYGTGTMVPLRDALDPDTGVGYPAGFRDSALSVPADVISGRDERLVALAWRAVTDGSREIVLTEESVLALAAETPTDPHRIPPHVELSARVRAADTDALERGDFTLVVLPARGAGVLTARFAPFLTASSLPDVYRDVPTGTAGALPVQLSCPPVDVELENVCRVPAYLSHVLPLGEHRSVPSAPSRQGADSRDRTGEAEIVGVDDLAVLATDDRLLLVSVSRHRVVEPQTFHALSQETQLPPLARFVVQLPRAYTAVWKEFDWGPCAARLPYLPRVRHGRSILSPARWYLTRADVPGEEADQERWRQALAGWRTQWGCPSVMELRHGDRVLRLDLDEPAHNTVLRDHLRRHSNAVLTETETSPSEFGWIGGHANEVALPLLRRDDPAPAPLTAMIPPVLGRSHGHQPGSPETRWLYAKIGAHPERQPEILADHLPRLLTGLEGDAQWWFVRYRGPQEAHHLRLRIRTDRERFGAHAAAVGRWAADLRDDGMADRLSFDTYYPETGRYGGASAMDAAEAVFAADSAVVTATLRHISASAVAPAALAALHLIDIVRGLSGSLDGAMSWLAGRPAPPGVQTDRALTEQVIRWARRPDRDQLDCRSVEIARARRSRATALKRYRHVLPEEADADAVAESLLHMHCNRFFGIDGRAERVSRGMARKAALAWFARAEGMMP
ncbi:lantibiotic dehydratase [Streptomyces sp. NPDC014734]|uniref:lantibiotic dehydratase n=1 Tax=Streptomyces sp. NPDC014734 TaxID=3364886 RepID=UPI0036FB5CC9